MDDYISRKAAIVDFERCNHENPVWTPQRVKTLLMRIPAADVVPVRHGRWEIDDGKNHCHCTACFFGRNVKTQIGWNYCPYCGAKMDGGAENEAD